MSLANRALPTLKNRRVVITGLGVLSPLGCNVATSWKNLVNGECGVVDITKDPRFVSETMPVTIGAPLRDFNPQGPRMRITNNMANSYPVECVYQALKDANLNLANDQSMANSTGLIVGASLSGVEDFIKTVTKVAAKGYNYLDRLIMLKILNNIPASNIAQNFNIYGFTSTVSGACATGSMAIGEAFEKIRLGRVDRCVATSSDSAMHPFIYHSFHRLGALCSKYQDQPQKASRPFDQGRAGFVVGEGAGAVVLEDLEAARQRGAKIYAEIRGFATTGDGFHLTQPRDDGMGGYRAMRDALENAGVAAEEVDLVNAHATSTPKGDQIELATIEKLFEGSLDKVRVNSNKGAIGHLLGSAGMVEAIFSILSLHHGVIPPTLNLDTPIESRCQLVRNEAVKADLNVVLKNSFGFGGINSSLIFTKAE